MAVKSSPEEIKIVQMSRGVPTGPEQRADKIPWWMSVTALWWLEQRFGRRGGCCLEERSRSRSGICPLGSGVLLPHCSDHVGVTFYQ